MRCIALVIAAALQFGLGGQALATSTISCMSADAGAGIELTLGDAPVAFVAGAHTYGNGVELSTLEGNMAVGQAFSSDDTLMVDFTDSNVEDVIVSVRLFRAAQGGDLVSAGILTISGAGAFAVICEGP